ncbi:beta-lactamase family protein [Brachybacterium huguangmaarense]|uniref:Beta-lactamase n=1 Tax=Brachybacterium huguangmaarense TaxID=1652028 RepID=A0ABY6G320_9MICO|nr:serine hydrolase domain-containing protein [Brachybacterium huguangmaarense]UYG17490.1 beta-lactamase family protein [Brachybacterium huguangmaarense]
MPATPTTRPSRRAVLGAAVPAVLVLGAAGALGSPRPAALGEPTGDTRLADALAQHLDGHRRVAAALVTAGGARFAGFGADRSREFEIGSVSKTFTASLTMAAVARGELTLDSTVADVLGDRASGSAIADVSIAELASHTSGLPSLPSSIAVRSLLTSTLRKDPYAGHDADDVIEDALGTSLGDRGQYAYSNLATALEGQLLATAADSTWDDLLRSRVLGPLGLEATRAPLSADALGDGPTGHAANGHGAAAWTMDGYAPAGGIRSTVADLAIHLGAMMDGTHPGAAAIEPTADVSEGSRIGVHWLTTTTAGGERVTWHNGMTGGFAAFCGWNRDTEVGFVALTDTARSLDALSMDVLDGTVTA